MDSLKSLQINFNLLITRRNTKLELSSEQFIIYVDTYAVNVVVVDYVY